MTFEKGINSLSANRKGQMNTQLADMSNLTKRIIETINSFKDTR